MRALPAALAALGLAFAVLARGAEPAPVTFGAFVDTYYAYDFNRPLDFNRSFTTQPARHNEFNVNLAFIEARLATEHTRGRLALQAGTSVQANYAAEPTIGTVSGASLSRHIQEAVAGFQLAPRLWLDGGIYFSHIGFESFISRDNWTYSRSLMSDFSPYYQTGVKLSWELGPELTAQLHVFNGWQNISENNPDKALGVQLAYSPSPEVSLTYNNFLGREPDALGRFQSFRVFNDFIARVNITSRLQTAWVTDLGFQQTVEGMPKGYWYVLTALARYRILDNAWLGGRIERFMDRNQLIVATQTPNGFQTGGASLNFDLEPRPRVLWRTEVRALSSLDALFPGHPDAQADDVFLVSSLALSI